MDSEKASSSSIEPSRPGVGIGGRLIAAGITAGAGGLLGTAAWLSPDQHGHGTHEQLGLPACMWAQQFDAPCMTCGMTTSFSHAAEGQLLSSFMVQPMGFVLALMTAVAFWIGLYVLMTGSRVGERFARMLTGRALVVLGVMGGAAWVYKIVTWTGQA